MVKLVEASFSVQGDSLSPAAVEDATGFIFGEKDKRTPGEIGTRGRYKGQPNPYGSVTLFAPGDVPDEDKLLWLVDAVEPHADTLRQLGATDGSLYVTYAYEAQCNLAFDPVLLGRIAGLGFDFWVSCYDDPGAFEE